MISMGAWRDAGSDAVAKSLKLTMNKDGRPSMKALVKIPNPKARITVRHTVASGGFLKTEMRFKVLSDGWKPDLPRLPVRPSSNDSSSFQLATFFRC